jgi:uncharacterized protein
MPLTDLAPILLVGLLAGILGGLAGIGGSMVMIPGLALILGYDDEAHTAHHTYMAAAMTVNVLVALPAAWRHSRAKAVRFDLVRIMLPSMALLIVAGVLVSNRINGEWLKNMLAAFIAGYCVLNIVRVIRRHPEPQVHHERITPLRVGAIGGLAGFAGGVLGIGGGVLTVPLLQVVCRVPLRQAIGTSAGIMWMTALIGAFFKLASLDQHGRSPSEALLLAAAMGPTAVVGSLAGARLTHALPIQAVRIAISVLLLVAAARLADLF